VAADLDLKRLERSERFYKGRDRKVLFRYLIKVVTPINKAKTKKPRNLIERVASFYQLT
jgi:hypothetical protein